LFRADHTAAPSAPVEAFEFRLHAAGGANRPVIERFIADAYRQTYSAELSHFLPLLLTLGSDDHTQAALGMRPGAMPGTTSEPMFLEHYLDQPVEQLIAARVGSPVTRSGIVEIGNLAATRRGASPLLFLIMAAALDAAGFRWLAFTATPQVEKLVTRLQYQPLLLSEVDPTRLGDELAQWGSYYETRPQVMCVALADALRSTRASAAIATTLARHAATIASLAQRLRQYRLHHALFEPCHA
jgi:hypothetical protein